MKKYLLMSLLVFAGLGLLPSKNVSVLAQTGCTKVVAKDGSGDFTSIQAGTNALASGQTVCVKNGTYEEELNITTPNITIKAYVGTSGTKHRPVIDGRYNRSLLSGSGTGLRMPNPIGGNYLPRTGADGQAENATMWKIVAAGVTIDGFTFQNIAGRAVSISAHNVTVQNCNFYWLYSTAIMSNNTGGDRLNNITVKNNTALFGSVGSLDASRQATSTAPDPASGVMKFGNMGENLLVSGNYVAYGYGEGINIGKDNRPTAANPIIIEKNVVHDTRHKMLYVNSSRFTHVRSNMAFSSNPIIMLGGREAGGNIGLVDESPNKASYPHSYDVYFYNNIVVNGQKHNFDMGRSHNDLKNIYIGFNTFVEGPNTIKDNMNSSTMIGLTGIVENNIFYGPLGATGNYYSMVFRNNIWHLNSPPNSLMGMNSLRADPRMIDPQSQIRAIKFPGEASGTFLNFADLEFLNNGYQSDFQAADYSLNNNSPAINAASSRTAVSGFTPPMQAFTTDVFGNARGNNPDIGAIEFGGVPGPTLTPGPTPTQGPTVTQGPSPTSDQPEDWDLDNDSDVDVFDFNRYIRKVIRNQDTWSRLTSFVAAFRFNAR